MGRFGQSSEEQETPIDIAPVNMIDLRKDRVPNRKHRACYARDIRLARRLRAGHDAVRDHGHDEMWPMPLF
jgi:hypothetical protein